MARLGVFGGSFDPPHLGHLALGQAALEGLHLTRVLWVLTPAPPHKQGWNLTPLAVRERMVSAMVARDTRFMFSRVEMERPGPHYMVDTISELRQRMQDDLLVLLLGGDSLRDLPSWGRPQELLEQCTLGVMRRPGAKPNMAQLERVLPGISARTEFFEAPRMAVSSSDIRRRVHGGEPFGHLVLAQVAEIIEREELYLGSADMASPG
jgi:nicotinate-nucleotide adenylyltransferase